MLLGLTLDNKKATKKHKKRKQKRRGKLLTMIFPMQTKMTNI